jgi:hypothetical protein
LRVPENRVLRRIFEPKRENLVEGWRRLYNKEYYSLNASNIIMVIKSRRMRWVEHVVRKKGMRNV